MSDQTLFHRVNEAMRMHDSQFLTDRRLGIALLHTYAPDMVRALNAINDGDIDLYNEIIYGGEA